MLNFTTLSLPFVMFQLSGQMMKST